MPDPMPWKKRHRDPMDFSCDKRRGGFAERRLKVNFFCRLKFFKVIKTKKPPMIPTLMVFVNEVENV
jgi:hypothetical protein